ncbi:hypothetical protein NQZ68_010302 [Dissostichus eleginoides]|nr:hypothetical protein NQZ68_010302 [Dissostichus eleginoides]
MVDMHKRISQDFISRQEVQPSYPDRKAGTGDNKLRKKSAGLLKKEPCEAQITQSAFIRASCNLQCAAAVRDSVVVYTVRAE